MTLTAGLGFKTQHLDDALTSQRPGLWFEVHAENYMVDGGPRLAALMRLAERFPVSLHGVGLSIVSVDPPAPEHLDRLRLLADRVQPIAVSDHLAWQKWEGIHHSDFLPFPRTRDALRNAARNVDLVQQAVGRRMMIENPSLYVDLPGHGLGEAEFMTELAHVTGCGILLDVNNVFVSASNLGFSADAALDLFPAASIGEIHLAGHARDTDPDSPLIIDSHDAAVADAVWALYSRLIDRTGPRPTLIERDDNVPGFAELLVERDRAHELLVAHEPVDA
jgi:uncharacterized protein (UPF0276 family)